MLDPETPTAPQTLVHKEVELPDERTRIRWLRRWIVALDRKYPWQARISDRYDRWRHRLPTPLTRIIPAARSTYGVIVAVLLGGALSQPAGEWILDPFFAFIGRLLLSAVPYMERPVWRLVGTLAVFIFGVALYLLRQRHRVVYGLAELCVAIIATAIALERLPGGGAAEWVALAAAAYLIVRGCDNWFTGLEQMRQQLAELVRDLDDAPPS
jgi:hypothetical protein